jgi:hypothetical protein
MLHRLTAVNRLHARQVANGGILVLRQGVCKSHNVRGASFMRERMESDSMLHDVDVRPVIRRNEALGIDDQAYNVRLEQVDLRPLFHGQPGHIVY